MIPVAVPLVPPMTLAKVFGPLAPLLAVAVLAGLAVLIGLIAVMGWAPRRRIRLATPGTAAATRPPRSLGHAA